MTPAARLAFTIYALFGDLLRDVLDENGEALGDSGEPTADGGHNPVDVAQPGSGSNLQLFFELRLASLGNLPHDDVEVGNHFVHAQSHESCVGRDFSEKARKLRETRVRELESQFVRGDSGDADRRRFEDSLESDSGVDFATRQLFGCAMAFERHSREPVNVRGGADTLRNSLDELEILRIE